MADPKQESITWLRTEFEKIMKFDAGSLATGKDLGAMNFKAGEPLFRQMIDTVKELNSLPLDVLPMQTLQQLQSPVGQIAPIFTQISNFSLIGNQNPEATRNQLLAQAQQHHDALLLHAMPSIPYLTLKSTQGQEMVRRNTELLTETSNKVNAYVQELEQKRGEMDSIVKATRDAAAKVGVAQFATRFEETADDHDKVSKAWLGAAIALGLATAGVALALIWLLPPIGTLDAAAIQRIITKLVIISVFYLSAVWAAGNYRAHRHLWVVNKHRQNALATFQTFVHGAGDDMQTKNAVLLEATRCVFSPSITGYLSGGADEEAPISRVVEILKATGDVTKS
jgi:hypothetical protein